MGNKRATLRSPDDFVRVVDGTVRGAGGIEGWSQNVDYSATSDEIVMWFSRPLGLDCSANVVVHIDREEIESIGSRDDLFARLIAAKLEIARIRAALYEDLPVRTGNAARP